MTPSFQVPQNLKPYQRRLDVGGVNLHLYDSGTAPQGPAFLLLHGLGDEADTWRRVFPLLMGLGRVVAPDLPGFGRSGHPRRAYTLDFFADVAAALLENLHIPQAVVVGHSMGAGVALRLALRRPEKVARLVLVNGPPLPSRLNRLQLAFLLPGLGESIYNSFRRSQEAAYESLRPYYCDLETLPPEERHFLRQRVWDRVWSDEQRRAYFSTFRWLVWEGLKGWPQPTQLARIKAPTAVVWGEKDALIPLEAGRRLGQWIPGARLYGIPACGHLPQQEQPEQLVRYIHEATLA